MKTILVPVDFSDPSRVAADYAMMLAKAMDIRVLFMNAYHPFAYSPEAPMFITKSEQSELAKSVEQELKEWTSKYFAEYPRKCSYQALEGFPGEMVLETAQSADPYMIIMGRKGMGRIERALLGSVSMHVIRRTKHPVLLVPEGWKKRPLKRILMATDYRKGDMSKAVVLAEIAKATDGAIAVLHATAGDKKDFFERDLMTAYKETLQSRLSYPKMTFELVFSGASAEHAVHEYIKKNGGDLLAVSRTKDRFFHRLLLPGFTQQALKHADVPLLVFPNAGPLLTFPEIRIKQASKKTASA